jgi:uncharacterized membrane protein YhaH (DUF805 family)
MTISNEGSASHMNSHLAPKSVDFIGAIKGAFSKYATFKGRASRSEFWYYALFYFSLFLLPILGASETTGTFGLIGILAILASILPFYSVMVRRLHDTGKSGWWWWITIIPFGGIVLIVFLSQESESIDNIYGPMAID